MQYVFTSCKHCFVVHQLQYSGCTLIIIDKQFWSDIEEGLAQLLTHENLGTCVKPTLLYQTELISKLCTLFLSRVQHSFQKGSVKTGRGSGVPLLASGGSTPDRVFTRLVGPLSARDMAA